MAHSSAHSRPFAPTATTARVAAMLSRPRPIALACIAVLASAGWAYLLLGGAVQASAGSSVFFEVICRALPPGDVGEICVSPAESNGAITMDSGFEFSTPSGAADPKLALWDPGFNADFTASGPKGRERSHFSYAHMLPSGPRLETWANTFRATEAVVGNRGPLISGLDAKHNAAFNTKSNTLLIHGSKTTWEGNIAYNDNHVSYESRLDPETSPYTDDKGKVWFDHLFFDEQDDPTGKNNLLGNFNRAGPVPTAFKAIWD